MRGNRRKIVVRYDFRPGVAPHPERRARRQRQQVRQEVAHLVHQVDHHRPIRHADVHVQAEDQERPRQLLQFLDDVVVADAGRDDLVFPARERMRAGRGHREADALGGARQLAAVAEDLLAQLVDVGADLRADLDDRLVHFALDLLAQHRRARRQELGHVRTQFAALRVDDLEFFFDAEGEAVHEGDDTSVVSRQSASRQSQSSVSVVSPSRQSAVGSPSRQSQSSVVRPVRSWHLPMQFRR